MINQFLFKQAPPTSIWMDFYQCLIYSCLAYAYGLSSLCNSCHVLTSKLEEIMSLSDRIFQVFQIYVMLLMNNKSMSQLWFGSKELWFSYVNDLFYVGIMQSDKVYENSWLFQLWKWEAIASSINPCLNHWLHEFQTYAIQLMI